MASAVLAASSSPARSCLPQESSQDSPTASSPGPSSTSVSVRRTLTLRTCTLTPPLGLQTQSATRPEYRGPWDAIKKIYAKRGVAGIYKGQAVTLLREASGYAVYFWAYEKLMQREMATKHIRRDEVSPAKAVLFGAAAGYVVRLRVCRYAWRWGMLLTLEQLWAVIYPIDMIKSRLQTDGFSPADGQKYKSALDCVRTVWRTEGAGAFVRGLGPTLIRQVSYESVAHGD